MNGGYEIVLWALLAIATCTDLLWGKIFNALTLPFILGGILCRFYFDGSTSAAIGIGAVVIAFALFFPLYLIKTLAAADVKLLMAVGAWSDTKLVIQIGIASILIGAVVGGYILLRKNGFRQSFKSVKDHAREKSEGLKSLKMPFGPAFLCAFALLRIAELKGWNLI